MPRFTPHITPHVHVDDVRWHLSAQSETCFSHKLALFTTAHDMRLSLEKTACQRQAKVMIRGMERRLSYHAKAIYVYENAPGQVDP
jgi:hypothetical protein